MNRQVARLSKNARGFGHWAVLAAFLVVIGIGAVGYRVHFASHADSISPVAKADCFAELGRVWQNGTCAHRCATASANPGILVVANPYDYCSNTASNISRTICDNKNRQFHYGVCLKEWNRGQGAIGYTIACKPHSYTYHIADPYDYCSPN